ncbi:family 16 glycosylhydrolase [Yinghuangia sp. YIM S10712]|uniref:family 16 glycosylhydrolase n=1 Tax=Yinghuangia sp. YIM S10712 TaxID=3436930 RepID=UPI003F52ED50
MSRRAISGGGGGRLPGLPRQAKWWGLGAVVAALLSAPVLIVANAVSDDGSDRVGSAPQQVAELLGHPGWELEWSDEFDGTALDGTKWMTCLSGYDTSKPCKGATDGEQQKYIPEQVTVSDGSLHLTAERKPVDGLPFSSGAVSTGATAGQSFQDSRALFSPGVYIEARVRLAPGVAMWPAMWLMPMVPQEPYRPEIDVFEFGGEQRLAQARLHAAGPCEVELGEVRGESECYGELSRSGTHFVDDYRLFGVNWQEDRLTYYADGEPILTVVGDAVPRERMYLIFNLAVGGIMGGDTERAPDKSAMSIDYVRSWRGSGEAPVGAAPDGTATGTPTAPAASAAPSSPAASPSATSSPPAPSTTAAVTTSAAPSNSPRPPVTSVAPAPPSPQPPAATPPPAQLGEPWLEFLAPGDGSTVRGVVTVKVRVNGDRDRVQEVSFYLNSEDCDSPKGDAEWIGYDRDDDNDGVYVYTFDSHRLSNGCNTISTVGIDVDDEYRYYPAVGRVHLDVQVAN